MGLDGLLRARGDELSGILNGIDVDGLEPRDRPADRGAVFDAKSSHGRAANKAALQARLGLGARPGQHCCSAWSAG